MIEKHGKGKKREPFVAQSIKCQNCLLSKRTYKLRGLGQLHPSNSIPAAHVSCFVPNSETAGIYILH